MRKSKSKKARQVRNQEEEEEISNLTQWIESQKPQSQTNPLFFPSLPKGSRIGRLKDNSFSAYAGSTKFSELPLSKKTKDGLKKANYVDMTEIQRASLPHALCGRDILGASKTGTGKTLAFVIPVLEKLYRERWGPEDGVGSIIISPTRELASQLFDVLNAVGKFHNFSAGLLIGGRSDIDTEKERVNELNILICTPGRLLQHLDETPNFECSQLQVLVLDEADRILDVAFKSELNSIVSQLPKQRQTLLFSATQTKSVKDLARLSLKDPEYLSVHDNAIMSTPNRLVQTAIVVPLDQKLDMLWTFIKMHLDSKILVFLSSCKQVNFVFKAFKALRPGIPLKSLHGRMKQQKRMEIYAQFCEKQSVLFSTDVASRGLDFNKAVDWVVQVDCPEDFASYIHRVGRTARHLSAGRSVLFLMPSELKMIEKLRAENIPIEFKKPNRKKLYPVSPLMSGLLVKDEEMQKLAEKAFKIYLRSVHIQKDKEVFDVMKLPIDEFSASLGLPMTPRIHFLDQKMKKKKLATISSIIDLDTSENKTVAEYSVKKLEIVNLTEENRDSLLEMQGSEENGFLSTSDKVAEVKGEESDILNAMPATRVLKKKKLKINIHRPVGTRVVFDDEGKSLAPLARVADTKHPDHSSLLDLDQKEQRYRELWEELKRADKEDKLLDRQRRRDKRLKEKRKWRKEATEENEIGASEEEGFGSEEEESRQRKSQKKKYFHSDSDSDDKPGNQDNSRIDTSSISLAEQEALALKLLDSMHKK